MLTFSLHIVIGTSDKFDVYKTCLSECRSRLRLRISEWRPWTKGMWKGEEDFPEPHELISVRIGHERRSVVGIVFFQEKTFTIDTDVHFAEFRHFAKRRNRKRVGDRRTGYTEHPFPENHGNFSMFSRQTTPVPAGQSIAIKRTWPTMFLRVSMRFRRVRPRPDRTLFPAAIVSI